MWVIPFVGFKEWFDAADACLFVDETVVGENRCDNFRGKSW